MIATRPVTKMPIIQADKSREFIRQFNRNVGSSDFIDSCKKAGRLFKKRK